MNGKKNGVGQHLAWKDYADILAKVMGSPMTARQVSEGYKVRIQTVRRLLRLFKDQRLLHICAYVNESRAVPSAIFAFGHKPDAPMPPKVDGTPSSAIRPTRAKPQANVIVFCDIVRHLEQGLTTKDVSEATGANQGHIARLFHHMRQLGIVHICEYQKPNDGYPAAVYKLGSGRNATYPKAMSPQEKSARQWADRKAKRQLLEITHALAGSMLEAA